MSERVRKKERFRFDESFWGKFSTEIGLEIDSQEHAEEMVNLLIKHFELPECNVEFKKRLRKPHYSYACRGRRHKKTINHARVPSIVFPWNPKYPIRANAICFFIAFHHLWIGERKPRKTKELLSILEKVTEYCLENKYWGWVTDKHDKPWKKLVPMPCQCKWCKENPDATYNEWLVEHNLPKMKREFERMIEELKIEVFGQGVKEK